MSKGVLLFALNTEFKYTDLAEIAAKQIKNHLSLPVSVVVNDDYADKSNLFDKIIKIHNQESQKKLFYDGNDSQKQFIWLNFSRADCYDLTPYDETLVIDVDYIVASDHLNVCFEIDNDFLIFKDSFDLSNTRKLDEFKNINRFSIPFYWATVFYFKKTKMNELFFRTVRYIKSNWKYYCNLYQIGDYKFRNDFAFSIAIHLLFNHTISKYFNFIPGKQFFTIDRDYLYKVTGNRMHFLLANMTDDRLQPAAVSKTDVHIMNKFSILRTMYE